MADTKKVYIGIGICGCTTIVLLIIILCSLSAVIPLNYGVKLNTFSRQISSPEAYIGGRYFVGPFVSFVGYPRYAVHVEFSNYTPNATAGPLNTRTSEGLSLGLAISFQYQIQPEYLQELFNLATTVYEETYVRVAMNIIMAVAGNYTAPQYWLNRSSISQDMLLQLNNSFQPLYANVLAIQMLNIVLPSDYETNIVNTQVQEQQVLTNENYQQTQLILSNITLINSTFQANITEINATAIANITLQIQNANANKTQTILDAEQVVYNYLMDPDNLNLNSSQLDAYIIYNGLDSKNNEIMVGLNDPYVVMLQEEEEEETESGSNSNQFTMKTMNPRELEELFVRQRA